MKKAKQKMAEQASETFTVWMIESEENTVMVNCIANLSAHICDLALCYLAPGGQITVTASEMTRERWDKLPEFEGK